MKGKTLLNYGLVLSFFLLILLPHKAESSEDSLYDFLWLDPDKSVYVLQNKTYKKAKTFFGEINGMKIVGNEFLDSYGLNVKLGYYFSEEWGFALTYNHYENNFNDNWDNVRRVGNAEPFLRRFKSIIGGEILWTPFYGKVNTFNRIFYFDWGFGLGLAQVDAESNIDDVITPTINSRFTSESHTGLLYKTDFKVHIDKRYYLNIELRNITYSAPFNPSDPGSKKLQTHTDFIFGMGMKF